MSAQRLLLLLALVALPLRPVWAQQKENNEPAFPEAIVKLTDPGAEPRYTLRYVPKAGDHSTMRMAMNIRMEYEMGDGVPRTTTSPSIVMFMELVVKAVGPTGDISADFILTDAKIEPHGGTAGESEAEEQKMLRTMIGMSGSTTVSSRGQVRSADFSLPDGADANIKQMVGSMRDSLRQLCSPLPEEPVGVGAVWTTQAHPKAGGIAVDQTYETRVTEIDAAGFKGRVSISQHGGKQKMDSPMLPAGTTMDLLSLESTGRGDLEAVMKDIVPRNSGAILDAKMEFQVMQGEEKTRVKQRMHMSITIRPAPPSEPSDAHPPVETPPK